MVNAIRCSNSKMPRRNRDVKKTTNARSKDSSFHESPKTRSEVNGPDKDKITIWWRENMKPREKMCGKINILNFRHYNSPITYKLKSTLGLCRMEITSSRIRHFGHGRYLPSVQPDIFECIQLLLSQITQQEWTNGNFFIRHFKFIWRRQG